MYKNKIVFLVALTYLITSCDTLSSVKRGLTGEKSESTDEFLVKRKDPLILPPDFESLPLPSERQAAEEEMSDFEKTLKKTSSTEETFSPSGSAEESILRQIKKN